MEQIHYSGATSSAATQKFANMLWSTKVHYSVHKSPPLIPILSQINPAHSNQSILISSHLRLGLPSVVFPSGFPTYNIRSSYPHSCYMPCPTHLPRLDHSN
jgi:hypothetical protein